MGGQSVSAQATMNLKHHTTTARTWFARHLLTTELGDSTRLRSLVTDPSFELASDGTCPEKCIGGST